MQQPVYSDMGNLLTASSRADVPIGGDRQKALTRGGALTKQQTDAHVDVAFVCKSHGQIARTLQHLVGTQSVAVCTPVEPQGPAEYLPLPACRILAVSAEYQSFARVS